MRQLTVSVPAGSTVEIGARGDWVRLKSASVAVRLEDPEKQHWLDLDEGDAVNLKPFNRLKLSHASGSDQLVTLLIGDGTTSDSAKVGGTVSIGDAQGAWSQSTVTVTNASGQLVAANAARRVLGVFNQSATGTVYLNLSGDAATVAGGVRLLPGESLLIDSYPPTEAVYAIGDIASNGNIIVVEG